MLSILIPTYNYNVLPLVNELIKLLINTKIDYEIIVLDDCSTDLDISKENQSVNQFENCFFEKNEVNSGRTYTRKSLAKKAKYDWLLFLDSDVLPTANNFISNYISQLNKNYDVIVGGYQYPNIKIEDSKIFRYKYGKLREERKADIRNKKPYSYVFSGNILIRKSIFLAANYPEKNNLYGLDNYFTYQLFLLKAKVFHIDNPIYHMGIEENEVFFSKSISSLESRILLLKDKPQIEKVDSIIKHYNFLKKMKLDYVLNILFHLSEPILKKMILSKNPSLLSFDLYRLGYICSLHK